MEKRSRIAKVWKVSSLMPESIDQELSHYSPFLRQLLFNRGIKSSSQARAYTERSVEPETDPMLLKGMPEGVKLLHKAIEEHWKIAVYGDYDVDGVTSSSLLSEFFEAVGNPARIYIPNRFEEGYGLNLEAMDTLASEGTQLLITVDCGIRSIDEVAHAKELGMQVIVTDHHMPDTELPPANAVINPHQEGDNYPYKDFAGVGVAYKLIQAYLRIHPKAEVNANHWLDLVAVGSVADVVPLTGENRALVYKGLQKARGVDRQGLFSLCQVSKVRLEAINTGDIGFRIGPRLNASGRLESALAAFHLLTTRDVREAGELAQKLDVQNSQRQEITESVIKDTLASPVIENKDMHVIFVSSPDYNAGVVGLAASKVVEAVYRPTIIGCESETSIKASCRSIEGFDINAALDQCDDLLDRHGGHAAAAGLSIQKDKVPEFIERMNKIALKAVGEPWPSPSLNIDMELFLDQLNPWDIPQIFQDMEALEPTGHANSAALFCARNCRIGNIAATRDGKHLRFKVKTTMAEFPAIAFGMGNLAAELPNQVDLAFTFSDNEYMGRHETQLLVKDIKPSGC